MAFLPTIDFSSFKLNDSISLHRVSTEDKAIYDKTLSIHKDYFSELEFNDLKSCTTHILKIENTELLENSISDTVENKKDRIYHTLESLFFLTFIILGIPMSDSIIWIDDNDHTKMGRFQEHRYYDATEMTQCNINLGCKLIEDKNRSKENSEVIRKIYNSLIYCFQKKEEESHLYLGLQFFYTALTKSISFKDFAYIALVMSIEAVSGDSISGRKSFKDAVLPYIDIKETEIEEAKIEEKLINLYVHRCKIVHGDEDIFNKEYNLHENISLISELAQKILFKNLFAISCCKNG
jgi:hypothetical protein